MELLYFLQGLRLPWLTDIMLTVTHLGDEIGFLVLALLLFWCVDKKKGYYILTVGFFGTIANQFLKLWFRIPRPWVRDPDFTAVESAKEGAGGYSFPSGHTQNAVGTFGGAALVLKNRWVKTLCIGVAVLVPFTRLYLGVHTPADVLTSTVIALALVFVMRPLVLGNEGKRIPLLLVVMLACAGAYLAFVELYPFPADVDAHNLTSGREAAYMLLGALLAFLIVYIVDEKWLHFPVQAIWWAQIIKLALGLGLVLAVKSGLKAPLNALLGDYTGRAVRYFLVVLAAGLVWPLTFRWFAKLGKKEK